MHATGVYEDYGIRFEFPGNWEVEASHDGTRTAVAAQAPDGLAFALVTLDEDCPAPAGVADEALTAMREEYPNLDSAPALDTIDGHRAIGHDVEFISLDMINSCSIRCFRTPRRTVLFFGQWSDLADGSQEALIRGVRSSLAETDG